MTPQKSGSLGVVITRSKEGNEELAGKLKAAGLDPIPVDTISLAPPADWGEVDGFLHRLDAFEWVVFTSPSGAKYFAARTKALSLPMPVRGRPRFAAVGERTARALSGIGVRPDFVPSSYTTNALGDELPAMPGASVLLLRADIAEPGLAKKLVARGFRVEEAAIYRTLGGGGLSPRVKDASLIVFASASAVRGFCAQVPEEELRRAKGLRAVCIGPVTESAARESGFVNTIKPETYTLDAVVQKVARLVEADA